MPQTADVGLAGIINREAVMNRWIAVGAAAVCAAAMVSGCGKARRERQEAAKELQNLAKQMEQAANSGGSEMQNALASMQQAMTQQENRKPVDPVDFRELKALLPEELAGMKRTDASGEKSGAMGMTVSKAEASYEKDDANLNVDVTDIGGLTGFAAMAQYGWSMHEIDRETETGYERTLTLSGHKAHEEYDREGRSGTIQLMIKGRFIVEIRGSNIDGAALQDAAKQLPLGKLEGMAK